VKPLHVWAAFGAGLLVVIAAAAAGTSMVLDVERSEREARALATLEENTRLALWRMDSVLMPLVAEEASRPPHDTTAPSGRVRLRVRLTPAGALLAVPPDGARLAELRRLLPDPAPLRAAARPLAPVPAPKAPADVPMQKLKSAREFTARQESYLSNVAQVAKLPPLLPPVPRPETGILSATWVNGALLLVRAVRIDGVPEVQAAWVDWPALESELLASVHDLLPQARLVPAAGPPTSDDERRLVTLPVRLEPGRAPLEESSGPSPVRLSLYAAWTLLAVAAASVGLLLHGVLALSERRRVFVSAVTHELRTPLTTFRLYTDMLALGMVPTEEKRREYVEKLQAEARRLAHLVENVLFYARLDGGRAGAVLEDVELGAFLAEVGPRLAERAERAGQHVEVAPAGRPIVARVDRSALEQVLVNLVDNACRYASAAQPPVIEVAASGNDGRVLLRVRDHGPGLTPADRKRLFRPFSKSDREAADSAPGVGLGLALSRRLMRAQGGDLKLDEAVTGGAGFVVSLPAGVSSPA
jgi:signal transduction histidine kinase